MVAVTSVVTRLVVPTIARVRRRARGGTRARGLRGARARWPSRSSVRGRGWRPGPPADPARRDILEASERRSTAHGSPGGEPRASSQVCVARVTTSTANAASAPRPAPTAAGTTCDDRPVSYHLTPSSPRTSAMAAAGSVTNSAAPGMTTLRAAATPAARARWPRRAPVGSTPGSSGVLLALTGWGDQHERSGGHAQDLVSSRRRGRRRRADERPAGSARRLPAGSAAVGLGAAVGRRPQADARRP